MSKFVLSPLTKEVPGPVEEPFCGNALASEPRKPQWRSLIGPSKRLIDHHQPKGCELHVSISLSLLSRPTQDEPLGTANTMQGTRRCHVVCRLEAPGARPVFFSALQLPIIVPFEVGADEKQNQQPEELGRFALQVASCKLSANIRGDHRRAAGDRTGLSGGSRRRWTWRARSITRRRC